MRGRGTRGTGRAAGHASARTIGDASGSVAAAAAGGGVAGVGSAVAGAAAGVAAGAAAGVAGAFVVAGAGRGRKRGREAGAGGAGEKGKVGRAKIMIRYIENDHQRQTTLTKRKKGLSKKVFELSTLCGVDICLLCYSPGTTGNEKNHGPLVCGEPNPEAVLSRYKAHISKEERDKKKQDSTGTAMLESLVKKERDKKKQDSTDILESLIKKHQAELDQLRDGNNRLVHEKSQTDILKHLTISDLRRAQEEIEHKLHEVDSRLRELEAADTTSSVPSTPLLYQQPNGYSAPSSSSGMHQNCNTGLILYPPLMEPMIHQNPQLVDVPQFQFSPRMNQQDFQQDFQLQQQNQQQLQHLQHWQQQHQQPVEAYNFCTGAGSLLHGQRRSLTFEGHAFHKSHLSRRSLQW